MDIELLKELIPLLQSAGDGAFVLMLVLFLKPYFTSLVGAVVGIVVVMLIKRMVDQAVRGSNAFKRLWSAAGFGAHYGEITNDEVDKVLRAVEAMRSGE